MNCITLAMWKDDDVIKWNFSALLALCAVPGEFPSQRPVMRSFDVFSDLRLNKRLSKQSRHWWFETPWHSLWCRCNEDESTNEKWKQQIAELRHFPYIVN